MLDKICAYLKGVDARIDNDTLGVIEALLVLVGLISLTGLVLYSIVFCFLWVIK